MAHPLQLPAAERLRTWSHLVDQIEAYARDVDHLRVAPPLDPAVLRDRLDRLTFAQGMDAREAMDLAVDLLREHQVHTAHARYFGLFNPAPTTMGIVADALVAAFNPQIAAWSHNPFAAECERRLVQVLGQRFGYGEGRIDGTFASGGAEANHTAVLCALTRAFPGFARDGVRPLTGTPTLYVSREAHHSFLKAARLCGLGTAAVREIEVDDRLRMRPDALAKAIASDRGDGCLPFLAVATLGTTGLGAIDPVAEVAEVCAREGLWCHADAAWGGAAVMAPELAHLLEGVAGADSITFDAHKWMSVPMGAGLFLTRDPGILERTFRVAAGYMPKEAEGMDVHDPYSHSMQWSRRFIGLKVFLSLAVAGFDGYAEAVRHMCAMGDRLRARLVEKGFAIVNHTPLPLVCFVEASDPRGARAADLARAVVASGRAWVSTVSLPGNRTAVRACITNYRTGPEDVDALVDVLGNPLTGS